MCSTTYREGTRWQWGKMEDWWCSKILKKHHIYMRPLLTDIHQYNSSLSKAPKIRPHLWSHKAKWRDDGRCVSFPLFFITTGSKVRAKKFFITWCLVTILETKADIHIKHLVGEKAFLSRNCIMTGLASLSLLIYLYKLFVLFIL